MNSLVAELLLLRKRVAVWVLLGFWLLMTVGFSYILPYYAYTSGRRLEHRAGLVLLLALLPQNVVNNLLNSFPFFGGTIVLILGVLFVGSEFSWGTLTIVFTQRDSRLRVFIAKMATLGIALIPFVLLVYLLGMIASLLIAWHEGQIIAFPGLWDTARALAASWFIMAVWASLGVLLAVLFRGTSLAIGLGIIYGLVMENVISAFAGQIDILSKASTLLLRTNGYTIVSALGVSLQGSGDGPGRFSGELVSTAHAAWLFALYIVLFLGAAALILRRRDVAGAS